MDEKDLKSFGVIGIILIIAICLSIVGGQGGVTIFGGISLFAFGITIAFVIQWIAFIPAYIMRTDKFFDLIGAITYSTVKGEVEQPIPQVQPVGDKVLVA